MPPKGSKKARVESNDEDIRAAHNSEDCPACLLANLVQPCCESSNDDYDTGQQLHMTEKGTRVVLEMQKQMGEKNWNEYAGVNMCQR